MDESFPPLPDGEPFDDVSAAVMALLSGMEERKDEETREGEWCVCAYRPAP